MSTKRSRPTLTSTFIDIPARQSEPQDFESVMTGMAEDARKFNRLRQMGALGGMEQGGGPAPVTVQDQVAVGSALASMATAATGIAQKQAEIAQRQAESDRARAESTERGIQGRVDQAVDAERERHSETLDLLERLDKARLEADAARREADAARDKGERDALALRLDHIEERYQEQVRRAEDRAERAESRVAQLEGALRTRKSGVEEIIEAAASGDDLEEHRLVRVLRALAPGQQSAVLGPDGLPLDPNLRYAHGMADVLVQREQKKDQLLDRGLHLLERLYDDGREFFGLRGGTAAADPAALAAEMAEEGEAGA